MHGSVLRNPDYIRFSRENCVEVIAMEEMERALEEKSPHLKTYGAGKEEHLVEFPGLTIGDLRALSNSKAIEYMDGGKIPYTAIVDPHTLETMEAVKGTISAKDLVALIGRQAKALVDGHGRGVSRKCLDAILAAEAKADHALAAGDFRAAFAAAKGVPLAGEPEAASERVAALREFVEADARKALDAAKGDAAALAKLAAALAGTPLEAEAAQSGRR